MNLLRRDVELPLGTVLEVTVSSTYRVPLDENWDTDDSLTLDAIQSALGRYESDVCRELRQNYDCLDEETAQWAVEGLADTRFENAYEREVREGRSTQIGRIRTYVEITTEAKR